MVSFGMNTSSTFQTSYKCFSTSFFPGNDRSEVSKGGKIIMPASALELLSRLNVQYPMLFKLKSTETNRSMHCGVLEFVADEGKIYVPYWMIQNLLIEEGSMVSVTNVSLPVATFAKFEPQSVNFLDISNPKAVLENALRGFACLTVDDIIAISYNDSIYELKVLELKPSNAVTIIECDMRVDFAPPVGYEEPNKPTKAPEKDDEVVIPESVKGFQVFSGEGNRLDGKERTPKHAGEPSVDSKQNAGPERGVPNYEYVPGSLTFFRNAKRQAVNDDKKSDFEPFTGEGQQLKPSSKKRS